MAFFVKFWGVRGSIPTPGHSTRKYGGNTACVELSINGTLFICDAGTGLRELGIDVTNRVDTPISGHLFLSHTHWDHIQGFPFFVPAYVKGNTFYVYGTYEGDTRIFDLLSGQMTSSYFPVNFADLGANIVSRHIGTSGCAIGDTQVRFIEQSHPGQSYGYSFEANQHKVVYATDCELDSYLEQEHLAECALDKPRAMPQDLIDFVQGSDLLICDAQYTDAEYLDRRGWGHPRATTAVDLAVAANVKQLALFHHDPMHSDHNIDALLETCRKRAKAQGSSLQIFPAREGLELKIDQATQASI